jgi:hypothetical protein
MLQDVINSSDKKNLFISNVAINFISEFKKSQTGLYRNSNKFITPIHNKIHFNYPFLSPTFLQMSTKNLLKDFFGLNNKNQCSGLYTQVLKYLQKGETCLFTNSDMWTQSTQPVC